MRRKVCFVLPSLAGGGAERAAVQILNALDHTRWDRSMYLFRKEGPYLGELAEGVRLYAGAKNSRFGRWRELRRGILPASGGNGAAGLRSRLREPRNRAIAWGILHYLLRHFGDAPERVRRSLARPSPGAAR